MKRISALISAAFLSSTAAFAGEIEDSLRAGFDQGTLNGLHGVLVQRGDDTLAEIYFQGPDERWGMPLGDRQFGPDELHDLRSVSKSIVSLLYGIALDKGLVPPPDAPLLAQFPKHADLSDPKRDAITIEDVLTMLLGLEWNENLPYTDPRNSEIAMEQAPDKVRFILSRPIVAPPGTQWVYSGGATALLGELIGRGSGQSLDQFAQTHLFAPLGITQVDWVPGLDGRASAASGLRLTARDLARIGQMIANSGTFDGKQIVPSDWLVQSLTAHADTAGPLRYGYHWWLAPEGTPPVWAAGLGNGGQQLSIGRETGTIIVIQAGNYNKPDGWRLPVTVINSYIAPNL
ncbi:MAG: serine hydrolase [Rhodobacteraceae bacterium]|nr:serine hydrolase [Paracoccaceae bacterium]